MSVFGDREFNRQLALLHFCGFWNQVIPVLAYVLKDPLQIWAEINSLRIAQDIERAHLASMRPCSEAEISLLPTSAATAGRSCLGSLLNGRAGAHPCSIFVEWIRVRLGRNL